MFRVMTKSRYEKIDPSKMAKTILSLGFLICLFIFLPLHASATIYYAATNGDNSWDGLYPDHSQGGSHGPKKTLNTVLGMLKGGDTMYIRGGTYHEIMSRSMPNNDVNNNWITIASYPGEWAILDGGGNLSGGMWGALISMTGTASSGHDNWIKLQNLEVAWSRGYGIKIYGASRVWIDNIYCHHCQDCGICCSGADNLSDPGCDHVLIENCDVWYNSMLSEYGKSGAYANGLSCRNGCSYVTVKNCIVWENWGEGINNYNSTHVTVQDCISYDNMTMNFISDNNYYHTIERCVSYYTVDNICSGYTYSHQACLFYEDETDEPGPNNQYVTIRNNIFCQFDGDYWCFNGESPAGTGFVDAKIYNNLFYNNSSTYETWRIHGTYNCSNSYIKNNIFIQDGSKAIANVPSGITGVTYDYNCWSKATDSDAKGAHDYVGNPKILKTGSINRGEFNPSWAKLASDSPVINIGASLTSDVTEDFWGTSRPQGSAYDIGACEFVSGASSLTASAAGSPTSGQAPLTVNFTGSASGGTSPYTYSWAFGDGGSSTSQNPSHTYSSASTYTATLTVKDSTSSTASKSVTITVTSTTSPLTASASASPTSGYAPLTVNFTGSATGGTSPYSYKWTFGDGGSSTSQNPSHAYSSAGTFTATLTVKDSTSATASKSVTITVTSAPTQLVATASADPTSGPAPLTVNFTGSGAGGSPPYSYNWNFGDGSSSSVENPSHTYSAIGIYTVILAVTDSTSANTSATLSISVESATVATLALAAETGAPAPGEGGTTDPSPGNYSFSIGSTVSTKSVPYTDYRFSKWTRDIDDSSIFSSAATLTMDKNKSLSATFCTKCGDVNGDLKITPGDAQLAFDIYLGRIANPTWCELENADVNCSGTKLSPKVTPADAQMIFHKFLRKRVTSTDCSGNSRAAALSVPVRVNNLTRVSLTVNDVTLIPGQDILVPIIIESPFEITAFGFDLAFPSDVLTYIGLESTDLTKDYEQLDANVISPQSIYRDEAKSKPSRIPMRSDSIFASKLLMPQALGIREPSQALEQPAINMTDSRILRVGGYKTNPGVNPFSGVLVTLIFRVIGVAKEASPISIIATYDDLQDASIRNGMISQQNNSQIRETQRPRRNVEKKPPAKRTI
jgi:PKD repeat protein